jgi:hypothetical protein
MCQCRWDPTRIQPFLESKPPFFYGEPHTPTQTNSSEFPCNDVESYFNNLDPFGGNRPPLQPVSGR